MVVQALQQFQDVAGHIAGYPVRSMASVILAPLQGMCTPVDRRLLHHLQHPGVLPSDHHQPVGSKLPCTAPAKPYFLLHRLRWAKPAATIMLQISGLPTLLRRLPRGVRAEYEPPVPSTCRCTSVRYELPPPPFYSSLTCSLARKPRRAGEDRKFRVNCPGAIQ